MLGTTNEHDDDTAFPNTTTITSMLTAITKNKNI
jgi:hypothetical protein